MWKRIATVRGTSINRERAPILERDHAEAARARLAAIIDSSADAIISTDLDGIIQSWNAGAERTFGYRAEELIGRSVTLLLPADQPHAVARILERLGEGERIAHFETVRVAKDGRPADVSVSVSPLNDHEGRIIGASAIIRDISGRKAMEEALRDSEEVCESEERLRMVLQASTTGWWYWDLTTGQVTADAQAKALFGLPADAEATFDVFLKVLDPAEICRVLEELPGALAATGDFDSEFHLIWPDGTSHWVQAKGRTYHDQSEQTPRLMGLVMDITARKRAEEELKAARQAADLATAAAEEANRAKDHFLAVLSHELRTPLTPVVMGVSLLQDRSDLDPTVRETLEMFRRNIEMEARLIDDLLDVTRIARGKIELQKQRVQLCSVIQLAVEICKPDVEARGLAFDVDLGPPGSYWVEADVSRLQQVFWNLLKNAIKFTPRGGRVGISCQSNGGHVVVEVNDSGIGIASEALTRVFNAFEQAERSITRQFGGLGLGLAISKALVEMHGGWIEAHSKGRDKGATFRVLLPLAASAEAPLAGGTGEVRAPAAASQRAVRALRILLVEDHSVTAKMMRMVLTADGHLVETAADVATALKLADQHKFDLLVSDLGLPDGSGHDLLRQLRERGRRFPGIALSGYGQEEDVQRSRDAGFAAHLTKPASRQSFLEAIASVAAEQPAAEP